MSNRHSIATGRICATIKDDGAELTSLCDAEKAELLWQAGPEWPRHAPVLFPIVGRLSGDTLLHDGRTYPMGQHGFARDSRFAWTERTDTSARLRLQDSPATRASFPFPFTLDMAYTVADATLRVDATVANPGDGPLPCGVGAHPAFRWPLVPGLPKDAHHLEFDADEAGSALSVEGGLLGAPVPLPVEGRILRLHPGLFAKDALVIPNVASRSLRFVAEGSSAGPSRAITLSWSGYKDLGLWSKPAGASFLCVEPWFSMTSPVGWNGEFTAKPGLLLLEPGESRTFTWSVTV